MKTIHLFLSLILFSIFSHSFLSAAQEAAPVLDTKRNELRAGVKYYIVSALSGAWGGGLTMSSIGNKACPLSVVQEPRDTMNGLLLTFLPVNSSEGVVRISTDLNIKFSAPSLCPESTVWKVDSPDESTGRNFITMGGVEGNAGCGTIRNWFKIEKYGQFGYKLVYCPTVCKTSKVICKDIVRFMQDGKRPLAPADDDLPFWVVFVPEDLDLMQQGIVA